MSKRHNTKSFVLGASVALLGLGVYGVAVTIPNTFTSGSTISSAQMNANFAALKAAVDALEAKQNLVGKRGLYGYAWVNDASSATSTPDASYRFNSSGGAISVTRSSAGTYVVTFAGLGRNEAGGHVQVTSYGSGANYCKVGSWSSAAGAANNDFAVNVRCYTSAGVLSDSQFDIQVSW